MKSKAAIGNHPVHPAVVVIPIGAFFAAFVGDIAYQMTGQPFWYQFSYTTMLIGVIGALAAALFGFVDYFGVRMSEAGHRVATTHMAINLAGVVLYAANLWLRHDNGAVSGGRWTTAFVLEVLTFLAVGVSGWLGGQLSYEHKVGVVEHADPEATQIGMEEPAEQQRVPSRTRGLQG